MKLINVLDIDLDFFLSGVSRKSEVPGKRLDSENETIWPEHAVRDFSETRCGLSPINKKAFLKINSKKVKYIAIFFNFYLTKRIFA